MSAPRLAEAALPPATRRLLGGAFFLSGAAALVFEVVWTRLLLLEFGATSLSVAAVLAAFMGGMGVGAALAPRLLAGRRDPVVVYALLEAWAGLYGLATPALLSLVAGSTPERFAASLLALLPATAAMGASLPVLARALASGDGGASGSTVGRLYAINTAGAVAGPLLAAFALFPALGLSGTLQAASGADLLVGAVLLAHRARGGAAVAAAPGPASDAAARPAAGLLVALAVSGGSSMVYEVAWSRALALVFGSSVYGVSIMLATYLLGLAGGSALAARWVRARGDRAPEGACAWLLAASALAAFGSLLLAPALPRAFLALYRALPGGDLALVASQLAAAAFLMAPATLCLGAMLPVAVAASGATPQALGRTVAGLYTANLAGATAGTLLAAGLLLGNLGLEPSVAIAASGALLVAAGLFLRPLRVEGAVLSFAASVLVLAFDPAWDATAKTFGLYTDPESYGRYDGEGLRRLVSSYRLLYARDGPTATVSVQEVEGFRLLKINGKTDASNYPGDMRTQVLLAHLPLMAREARRVAVVGWGSGVTVGAVLAHPVESVDAFEIEPAVVEASLHFDRESGAPLRDPRVRLVLGDARAKLREGGPWDLVISEPSNPWLTGVANLFTADFFSLLVSRLTPDGVVCQWFHLYGMSEEAARSVVATFRSAFPHALVFGGRDLLMLGSRRPLRLDLARMQALLAEPAIAKSLQRVQVRYPFDVLLDLRLDEAGAAAFSAGAPLNTDDNMRLELSAPRSLYRDRQAEILAAMARRPPSLPDTLTGFRSLAEIDLERAASLFTRGRHEEALSACREALAREPTFAGKKLLGQILTELGRAEEARVALEEALALGAGPDERAFVTALLRSLGPAPHPRPPRG